MMIRVLAVVAGCLFWWSGLAHAIPITGLTGLDRADEVAGEHGQQGRDNARLHHTTLSTQNASFTTPALNGSFTTQSVGLMPQTTQGTATGSPTSNLTGSPTGISTAIPDGDPPQAIPEPTSVLLLGSGLVGLWFLRLRHS